MPRIETLFAYVISDESEDDEGVPAMVTSIGHMPLMGADLDRAASMRPVVQEMANAMQKPVRLIRSTGIEVVEVVWPDDPVRPKIIIPGQNGGT